jgi:DHA1 family bicyclomycin/chloramphenicol resistance-like MFS transporter
MAYHLDTRRHFHARPNSDTEGIMRANQSSAGGRPALAFTLVVAGTVLGLAGTNLVLPAVPSLPTMLGGTLEQAQLVPAAFVAGSACGLLLFGALGARFDQRFLLVGSLAAYGLISLLAGTSGSLALLVGLSLLQGAASAAAAVFSPGMIRVLFGDHRAVSAFGFLGSVESLTPALAPVVGVWLLHAFGWNAAYVVIGSLTLVLAAATVLLRSELPALVSGAGVGGYGPLLRNPTFMRYALSHAFTLGGLLVIVFGAPSVFVAALGGTLTDFIVMQITGIATFIVAANLTGRLSSRFGAERMIWLGTALAAIGAIAMLVYALSAGGDPIAVTVAFVPINLGLGLRGPPGFHQAVLAARGDDARGSALVVVAILGTTAVGTAAVAPFITLGLMPLAAAATVLTLAALVLLYALPGSHS